MFGLGNPPVTQSYVTTHRPTMYRSATFSQSPPPSLPLPSTYPLHALPLPQHQLLTLLKTGATNLSDVPSTMIGVLGLGACDLPQPPVFRSSDPAMGLPAPREETPIITLVQSLDAALGGGVLGVAEISGPSGAGKTQLCMQLSCDCSLPPSVGGANGTTIWVDAGGGEMARRLGCVVPF